MRPVLTRSEIRAFDAAAIRGGVPGLVLMENAGRGAAHLIGLRGRPRTGDLEQGAVRRGTGGSCVRCADERALLGLDVVIVCGPGNNGGDGFVVARHLLARAATVRVLCCAPEGAFSGDARLAVLSFRAVGGAVLELGTGTTEDCSSLFAGADLVVDALLGTGATRPVQGRFAEVIAAMNQSGVPIVALDVPSGLDAETGEVLGIAVKAEHTVTFAHLKTGLLTTHGLAQAGRITVSHIGVPATLPAELTPRAFLLEELDVAMRLRARPVDAHKKNTGHVAVVGGSRGMVGAARLAARAALRIGAGLATIVSEPEVVAELAPEIFEVMTEVRCPETLSETLLRASTKDALVVGPGLGRSAEAAALVKALLGLRVPTVLDADGLRALSGDLESVQGHACLVLTPHAGEAADLLGMSSDEVERDRFGAARLLAQRSGALVVLKGPRTLITEPSGMTLVSAFGTQALATGGTGDVLSGLLAGALSTRAATAKASQLPTARLDSVIEGVALHGLCAEAWSETGGDAGLVASDLVELLPSVRRGLLGA